MTKKHNQIRKDQKPISSFDLWKILSKLNLRSNTIGDCIEIIRILNEWNTSINIRDLNYEIRRRGIYIKDDIRHFSKYRLKIMITSRLISEIKNNGNTNYKSNIRLKPDKIANPKPLRYLKPISNLENKIHLYRYVALDSKDEDITQLLQQSLSKLELKLNDFIPHCKKECQKIVETISIIRELDLLYHEFRITKRLPDNECWLYSKYRILMVEIKPILLKLKEDNLE